MQAAFDIRCQPTHPDIWPLAVGSCAGEHILLVKGPEKLAIARKPVVDGALSVPPQASLFSRHYGDSPHLIALLEESEGTFHEPNPEDFIVEDDLHHILR